MAKLRTLTVDVRTDTQKFSQGIDKVNYKLNNMSKKAKAAGKVMAAALSGGAIVAATKSAVDYADNLAKHAGTVGLAVEALQEYQFAARRSGVEQSIFNGSMVAFVKRVGEMQSGTGPLLSFLKKYDMALADQIKTAKNQDQALQIVFAAINRAKTATEKAAIANAAFSRTGVKLAGMAKDYKTLRDAARDMGAVLSESVARQAEIASDKMEDMSSVIKTQTAVTMSNLFPLIVGVGNAFAVASQQVNSFYNSFKDTGELNTIESLSQRMNDLGSQFQKEQERLEKVKDGTYLPLWDLMTPKSERIEEQKKKVQDVLSLMGDVKMRIDKVREDSKAKPLEFPEIVIPDAPNYGGGSSGSSKVDKAASDAEERQSLLAQRVNSVLQKRVDIRTELKRLSTESSEQRVTDMIEKRNAALEEGKRIYQETRTPAEQLTATVEKYTSLLNDGAFKDGSGGWDTYARAIEKAKENFDGLQQKGEETKDLFKSLESAVNGWGQSFAQTLLSSEGKFSDFVGSILNQLAQIAIAQTTQPAFDMFGKFISGLSGSAGSINSQPSAIPARATGGPVMKNSPYLVGEHGPELFVPNSTGRVDNNPGNGGYNPTFNISGNGIDRQFVIAAMQQAKNEMKAYMQSDFSNRGRLSRAL